MAHTNEAFKITGVKVEGQLMINHKSTTYNCSDDYRGYLSRIEY